MNTIAAAPAPGNPPRKKAAFSDRLVDSLRSADIEEFSRISPYAACIFPILEALGRKGINRCLVEAMPHFAQGLDLVDLRNILVNVGYESDPVAGDLAVDVVALRQTLMIGAERPVVLLAALAYLAVTAGISRWRPL